MVLNKKIILGALVPCLGSLGAFGHKTNTKHYKIMVNYNGQADLLLSLQIPPDYYPYQFKKTTLYDYLTNIDPYIIVNADTSPEKKKIKEGMQKRLNELLGKVQEFGPSLWNIDLYDTGLVFRNDQFWSNKSTDLLFLEQFIADDYTDLSEAYRSIPKAAEIMVTNYRAARDPYTIFSEEIYKCFAKKRGLETVAAKVSSGDDCDDLGNKFANYIDTYNQEGINSLYRFGKYIDFWNNIKHKYSSEWSKLKVEEWLKEEKLFNVDTSTTTTIDDTLAKKYWKTIFTKEELAKLQEWKTGFEINYEGGKIKKSSSPAPTLVHHPALEQQTLPGTAPLAEGSQKEVMVFLYQFAMIIHDYVNSKSDDFNKRFGNDHRKDAMQNVLSNATEMGKNLKERIKNVRDYFKAINVVDNSFDPDKGTYTNTNSKTFTVLTYPPNSFGAGNATIQSMSKFPFIYHDIGLKQPIPKSISDSNKSQAKATSFKLAHEGEDESLENEVFSVDDNGWWWKIGNADLDPTNLIDFAGTADTLLILANPDDWNILNDQNSSMIRAVSTILKDNAGLENKKIDIEKINKGKYPVSYSKYHLWNEGLRSPIAINLLLDNLVDIFHRQYGNGNGGDNKEKYKKAMDWGEYWHNHFINGTSKTDSSAAKK